MGTLLDSRYRLASSIASVLFATVHSIIVPEAMAGGGGGGARCHCPCDLNCGGGVTCNCQQHPADCNKCSCGRVDIQQTEVLNAILDESQFTLRGEFAGWFGHQAYTSLKVGLEATMSDSGLQESWQLGFVPAVLGDDTYVLAEGFEMQPYLDWVGRIDRSKDARIYVAVVDDPADYEILDEQPAHLNDSLLKQFFLLLTSGQWMTVFVSDSTLEWEMQAYLRAAVAGIDEAAFVSDPDKARTELLGMLDAMDLMVKASSFEDAKAVLDSMRAKIEQSWLDPGHPDTLSMLCSLVKMRKLLDPTEPMVCS